MPSLEKWGARETRASVHIASWGALNEGSPLIPRYHKVAIFEWLQWTFTWTPMTPRDASFSNGCMSDGGRNMSLSLSFVN